MPDFDANAEPKGGRIVKAVFFGDTGKATSEYPSKQLTEDPFGGMYSASLTAPPYSLEQLVLLAESHPTHSAAIDQKVSDIIADGVQLKPDTEDDKDEELEKVLRKWWDTLCDEYTVIETLQAMWNDYETLAWGFLEIVRDMQGIVQQIYHVPAHTVRAHADGIRYVQQRFGKMVWFKKWGTEQEYYASNGHKSTVELPPDRAANELLVFRRPTRRSSWYGVPSYISSIGWIALAIASRDYNIRIMENNRQPRHLVTITGLQGDVDNTMTKIEAYLAAASSETSSNILIPIEGTADVKVARLGDVQNEIAFAKLIDQSDKEILISHRMPPDRLGFAERGALSGGVTEQVDQIYKEGIVNRGQTVAEDRLTKFMKIEFTRANAGTIAPDRLRYSVDLEELDISDESVDVTNVKGLVEDDIITLNEGRTRLKIEKHEPFGEMTLSQWKAQQMQQQMQQNAQFGMQQQMQYQAAGLDPSQAPGGPQPPFGGQNALGPGNQQPSDQQIQKYLERVAAGHIEKILKQVDAHVLDLLTESNPTGQTGVMLIG